MITEIASQLTPALHAKRNARLSFDDASLDAVATDGAKLAAPSIPGMMVREVFDSAKT